MSFWSALFSSGPAPSDVPLTTPAPRKARKPRKPSTPGASGASGISRTSNPAPSAVASDESLRRSSIGVTYRLQRVRRKSIGLVITTEGLLIRAPKWTPLYEIDAAIAERQSWITKALERQRARLEQLAAYRDGGHVLFRGNKLRVDVRQGLFESIDLTERHCIVTTLDGRFDPAVLDELIREMAQQELPAIAQDMARRADLPLKAVALSSARTMWGSCTSDGRVRLNFRLLQLAPELMRHVVAHELAHLIEFNHSKRFWAIVESLDPNTKAHKRAIKNFAVLLEL